MQADLPDRAGTFDFPGNVPGIKRREYSFIVFRRNLTLQAMGKKQAVISTVQWVFRVVLAGVLVFAGVLKLQDNSALLETVAYLPWLPVWLKWRVVEFLPWVEILVAVLLVIRIKEKWVLSVVGLIFTGFLLFAIYGFATGMEGDCGCFGEFGNSSFGWGMIFRNAAFVGMAGFLFYQPAEENNPD